MAQESQLPLGTTHGILVIADILGFEITPDASFSGGGRAENFPPDGMSWGLDQIRASANRALPSRRVIFA
jgi:hypothetical protein